MVGIGQAHGVRTAALFTAMDTPLGRTAGNAIEVTESIDVLRAAGRPTSSSVTVALAARCSSSPGIEASTPPRSSPTGEALPVWWDMVAAQGGRRSFELPEPAAGSGS